MPKYTGHIKLDGVFCRRAEFEQVTIPAGHLGPPPARLDDDLSLVLSVKWWEREDELVDVELGVKLNPEIEKQPYLVDVSIVGRFGFGDLPEGLSEDEFIRRNAAAILMPFAREVIGNLTMRGTFGPIWLPPVNVIGMLDRVEEERGIQAK